MKICKKCEAYNSDRRRYCVDCHTILGDSITKEEELIIRNNLDNKMDKLYHRNDPLYVDKYDKIMGIISIAGIITLIVISAIILLSGREIEYSILGIAAFLVAVLIALFPKIGWSIEKIRLSFIISNANEATPSYFYFISRKISSLIAVLVGIGMIVSSFVILSRTPVIKYIDEIANNPNIAHGSNITEYIDAKPDLWNDIIENENYSVSVLLNELKKASNTGIRELLIIEAIIEITGIGEGREINSKEDFIIIYYTRSYR